MNYGASAGNGAGSPDDLPRFFRFFGVYPIEVRD
jgi:hypothetical protein